MTIHLRNSAVIILLITLCLMFSPAQRITNSDPSAIASPTSGNPCPPRPDSTKSFEEQCQEDPLAALQGALARHRGKVEGYRCEFVKRERIGGKLRDREVIACEFQESPFSIRMKWLEGKGRADAMLYVSGENDNQLLIVPSSATAKSALKFLGKNYAARAPEGSEARDAARLPVTEFGLANAFRRTLTAWQAAKERGELTVEYLGVQEVAELGGLKCYTFQRTCKTPEEDGLTQSTVYVDVKNKQQVGIILRSETELVGEYFFKNVELNPKFANDHFAARHFK
ncbi:DUF1571 domain-containing protein [Zavarzinella formosa]|uniref:DUF1571 domain-containing protein n=1 Tax=Zavarzinella formosa TaxID=360055 RepID=UPI0003060822|nr:DUF1571 domain-containing protein [Zavarzinella formosa]